jgi:hypothetical protein
MLYREILAVCSEIHTKHINKLCGQNVELLNVKLAVCIVTVSVGFFYGVLSTGVIAGRMRPASVDSTRKPDRA